MSDLATYVAGLIPMIATCTGVALVSTNITFTLRLRFVPLNQHFLGMLLLLAMFRLPVLMLLLFSSMLQLSRRTDDAGWPIRHGLVRVDVHIPMVSLTLGQVLGLVSVMIVTNIAPLSVANWFVFGF
uniref:Uncharacterized protein n=1 Tax=Anopheles melas TaxID=34690 RepID=A0A182U6X0_9DIPT